MERKIRYINHRKIRRNVILHQVHHTIRKVHKVDIFIKKQMFEMHNLYRTREFPMNVPNES